MLSINEEISASEKLQTANMKYTDGGDTSLYLQNQNTSEQGASMVRVTTECATLRFHRMSSNEIGQLGYHASHRVFIQLGSPHENP